MTVPPNSSAALMRDKCCHKQMIKKLLHPSIFLLPAGLAMGVLIPDAIFLGTPGIEFKLLLLPRRLAVMQPLSGPLSTSSLSRSFSSPFCVTRSN